MKKILLQVKEVSAENRHCTAVLRYVLSKMTCAERCNCLGSVNLVVPHKYSQSSCFNPSR